MFSHETAVFPRLYHMPHRYVGAAADFPAELDRCQAMGFSHVLITPPFKTGPQNDVFLTADPDKLDESLASTRDAEEFLHWLAGECRARDMNLLIDLIIDQVASGHPLTTALPACFSIRRDSYAHAVDPRHEADMSGVAVGRFHEPQCADALIEWWSGKIARYLDIGVGGVRLLRPDALDPASWKRLIAAARGSARRGLFIASTYGISRERLHQLEDRGFDHVQTSLPWWDLKSSWLVEEFEALRLVAPPIAAPTDPLGDRLASAASPWRARAAHERMLTLACATGCGLMIPMGYEYGLGARFDPVRSRRDDFVQAMADRTFDLSEEIRAANDFIQREPILKRCAGLRGLSSPSGRVTALLRGDITDAADAGAPLLVLVNPDEDQPSRIEDWRIVPGIGGVAEATRPLHAHLADQEIEGAQSVLIAPGEARLLRINQEKPIRARASRRRMQIAAAKKSRIVIDNLSPGGRFDGSVKRVIGDAVRVECDILCDGEPWLAVELQWRAGDETHWHRRRMNFIGDQRWCGTFFLSRMGSYEFVVEAWIDRYGAFQKRLIDKMEARNDISAELEHGRIALEAALAATSDMEAAELRRLLETFDVASEEERAALLLTPQAAESIAAAGERPLAARSRIIRIEAERAAAAYGNWFLGGALAPADAIRRLPRLRAEGFDILSLSLPGLLAPPSDADARRSWDELLAAARRGGIELAVDLSLIDPSILEDSEGGFDFKRWTVVHETLLAWMQRGINIFRLRDAQLMPFAFWEWALADLKRENPSAMFVADGHVGRKAAERLTACGFSQAVLPLPRFTDKHEAAKAVQIWEAPALEGRLRPHFTAPAPAAHAAPLELIRCVLAATWAGSWSLMGGSSAPAAHDVAVRLNWLRRANPALQGRHETAFYNAYDRRALYYGRSTREREDIILVMVNLAPDAAYETEFELPLWEWGLPDHGLVNVEDLLTERRFVWQGKMQRTKFEPQRYPFAIWRIQPQR